MSRPIPESITNAEVQLVAFSPREFGLFHAKNQYAVENYGSAVNTSRHTYSLPELGDSFTWTSGGELYEYKITADIPGIIDYDIPVNNWYVSQKSQGGPNEDKTFYLDVVDCKAYVVNDTGRHDPTFKDISELSDILHDLIAEDALRMSATRYQFVAGKLVPNPYFEGNGS